jgi:hypothetical protein
MLGSCESGYEKVKTSELVGNWKVWIVVIEIVVIERLYQWITKSFPFNYLYFSFKKNYLYFTYTNKFNNQTYIFLCKWRGCVGGGVYVV